MIVRGWQARLYPKAGQSLRLNQWAGSLRFLWNRLLDAEKAEYAATGKFIWKKQLQPIAVGMKRQPGLEWLGDLPAHAVLDCVARLDGALRRMVQLRKQGKECGFPRRKKKFVNEAGIYCVGQAAGIAGREATLPKLGRVKLRGGNAPDGRLLASRAWRDGDRWMLSAQFECARPAPMAATGLPRCRSLKRECWRSCLHMKVSSSVRSKPRDRSHSPRRQNDTLLQMHIAQRQGSTTDCATQAHINRLFPCSPDTGWRCLPHSRVSLCCRR